MPDDFVTLFERFSRQQSAKDREVVSVRILEKRGVGRALVRLPTCEGSAGTVAQEPSPIACGATAQAVVNRATGAVTILPAPRSAAGQSFAFTASVRGDEPAVPVPIVGMWLSTAESPRVTYFVEHDDDGAPVEVISSRAALAPSSFVGPYSWGFCSRASTVVMTGQDSASLPDGQNYIETFDVRAGSLISQYVRTRPALAHNNNDSQSLPASAADGLLYWAELDFNDGAGEHTWKIMAADPEGLASPTEVESFTASNSTIAGGTVEEPRIGASNDFGLFLDGSTFQFDAPRIRYWDGSSLADVVMRITFGASPSETVVSGNVGNAVFQDNNLSYRNHSSPFSAASRAKTDRSYSDEWSPTGLGELPAGSLPATPQLRSDADTYSLCLRSSKTLRAGTLSGGPESDTVLTVPSSLLPGKTLSLVGAGRL